MENILTGSMTEAERKSLEDYLDRVVSRVSMAELYRRLYADETGKIPKRLGVYGPIPISDDYSGGYD
jgi:hypothetical protein